MIKSEVSEMQSSWQLPGNQELLRKAQGRIRVARKCFKATKTTHDLVGLVTKIPRGVSAALRMSDSLVVIESPFVVVKLLNTFRKLIRQKTVAGKIKTAFASFATGLRVIKAAAATCRLLNFFNIVSAAAVSWLPTLGIISFGTDILALGFSSEPFVIAIKVQAIVENAKRNLEKATDTPEKKRVLLDLVHKLEDIDQPSLQKILCISDNFTKHIRSVSSPFASENKQELDAAVAKGAVFLQTLRGHVSKKLACIVLSTVVRIADIIATGCLFFLPLTPAAVIGMSVISFATLGVWTGKTYFINDTPFSEGSCSEAFALYEKVKIAIQDRFFRLRTVLVKGSILASQTACV